MTTKRKWTADEVKYLVDNGFHLDQKKKGLEKELTAVKEELTDFAYEQGVKRAEGTDAFATFAFAEMFAAISVPALAELLAQRGLADKLVHVVKVDMTALRQVLGAEDIKALQGESQGTKISVSFKPRK